MQDKTGPACGKVPFVQLFFTAALRQLDYERWIRKKVLEGVSDVAPGAIVKQIRSSTGLSQRSFAESIHKLIYAVIRHVDDVEENYVSLVYTFFIGILAKGWGEGNGWRKTPTGWQWSSEQDSCQSIR